MPQVSAGLLLFRRTPALHVLLAHPGGPLWARKDAGAWTIPKGLIEPGEDLLSAARREFTEETGLPVPAGNPLSLHALRQASGKLVHAWALEADPDLAAFRPGTFTLEWPPRSGRRQEFPEIDRLAWFPITAARAQILRGQAAFLDQLESLLAKQHPA